MKTIRVPTREMSRGFTKLLRAVVENGAEVTVTSRGKPVAVLCPYEWYRQVVRRRALVRLWELSDRHLQGLTLEVTYSRSRRELEGRSNGEEG